MSMPDKAAMDPIDKSMPRCVMTKVIAIAIGMYKAASNKIRFKFETRKYRAGSTIPINRRIAKIMTIGPMIAIYGSSRSIMG